MKTLTLRIRDIKSLNDIQKSLSGHQLLTEIQQNTLNGFLSQLPSSGTLLSDNISLIETFDLKLWETDKMVKELEKWRKLFGNIPGWDYCPWSYFVDENNIQLLRKKIVIVAAFAPSYTHNEERQEGFEVHLKDDGTAIFYLPTLEDAEQFPELYHFKGSWKEAYLLLISTLQKGWPMEEFPEELQKFLPKQ